jgi:nitrate/nitrite transport system ATP-binding protein
MACRRISLEHDGPIEATRACAIPRRTPVSSPSDTTRFLLLDEPFSMLDSLTRFELQDTLLRIWEQSGKTVVMVTHDIDEALFLADRLILMTDGPETTVGETIRVPFARPRRRAAVLGHPEYHAYRRRVIDFLDHHARQSRAEAS